MRKTTNYKRYRDGGAVEAQPLHIEVDTPAAHIATDAATDDLMSAVEPHYADDASKAFQQQINNLRRSEEIQRERRAAPPLTKNQAAFVRDYPGFLDDHQIAMKALGEAHGQGLQEDSEEFHRAVKSHFERLTGKPLKPPSPAIEPSPSRAPEFSELPDLPDRASLYSAPTSRETSATGFHSEGPSRTVRLSVAQKEAARFAGVSEKAYAEGLLELEQKKRDGYYDR
jgi:hypothetical protein